MRASLLVASTSLFPLLACASSPPAAVPSIEARAASDTGTKKLLDLSARLTGSWVAKLPSGKAIHESFRTISSESALVESYRAGASETMSVYHADGAELLLVHYCAQGNQPRLRLATIDSGTLVFRLVAVTNLKPERSHLVEKRLAFVGAALEQTEIYEDADGARETTVLHFEREAAS